jgi:type IV secretion system protein VirD4
MRRVLPPPALTHGRYADAPTSRPDDWSALTIPAVPSAPAAVVGLGDADEGGPRRQPELSEAVAYSPVPDQPASDLALLDDDDDLPLPLPAQLDPRLQRAARLAALDPDDGISL